MQRYTFAVHMSGCKLLYIVIDFQRILMITYFKTKAYTNVLNIGLGQCLVTTGFGIYVALSTRYCGGMSYF